MDNMEILHPEKHILSMLSSLLRKNESAETHRYRSGRNSSDSKWRNSKGEKAEKKHSLKL